ncbi:MAG: chromosomal replication initiator protein DnaA [Parachlamydiales bacterium]|nr:chromosomal replication initiator protein DnaA [Parachlamydiales bacterium]
MQAWEEFLSNLEKSLGKKTIDQWLSPLKIVKFDACNLFLEAQDSFQITWFEEHIRPKLKKFINSNGSPIKVHINSLKKPALKQEQPSSPFRVEPDSLNPDMTLENFIDSSSEMSFQLLLELSQNYIPHSHQEPYSFNPFFIYGYKGSGKTHLAQGCAHALSQRGLKVFYIHAQTFTNHVVEAIRLSQMQSFRQDYRNIDVLIIDDIHIFSRKNATQEEFFHTFNALHGKGAQIIITSLFPPNELKEIEPRLISRFEWGITLFLPSSSAEQRKEILLHKAKRLHMDLKEDIIHFIIQSFSSTISVCQALETLALRFPNSSYGLKESEAVLKDLLEKEQLKTITPEKIVHAVAAQYGLRFEDIVGKSQTKECSQPRQIAMYLCRKLLDLPYLKIGSIFSRDHSTVMTNVKSIQKELEKQNTAIISSCFSITKKIEAIKN